MSLLSEGYGDDDIKELRLSLAEAAANPDPSQLRSALSHIVSQMTQGNSLAALFPELVKICATSDLPSKKLVYLYMAGCACEQPSLTLLAINCLLKDCQDSNPMVRGMALRTLCSLRLPLLLEYIEPPLLAGFRDKSAYVRRIAVLGCLKAYRLDPGFIRDRSITDQLCELVTDRDNVVMMNVLCALHELQGQLFVSQNIAHQLLNRLNSLSEWGQVRALQFMLSYKPKSEEELFDIMNVVDGCLRQPHSGVSLAAARLMLHLTKDIPHVHQDVLNRIKGILLGHLSSEQPALVFVSLTHLQWLLDKTPHSLSKHFKKFYCKYNEPTYLRCKRIDLLVQLTTESNLADIVGELSVYCIDVCQRFGHHAVHALGAISQLSPAFVVTCMDALVRLLQLQISHVSSSILTVLQELLSLEGAYQHYVSQVLDLFPGCWPNIDDEEGRCAIIWLVGHHGEKLPDAPYLLETAVDNIMEEPSVKVKGQLLVALTKLFFSRPAECQDSLATFLQHCIETEKDVFLKEKALLYYRMLNDNVKKARAIICSSQTVHSCGCHDDVKIKSALCIFNSMGLMCGLQKATEHNPRLPLPRASNPPPDHGAPAQEGTLVDLSLDDTNPATVKENRDQGGMHLSEQNPGSVLKHGGSVEDTHLGQVSMRDGVRVGQNSSERTGKVVDQSDRERTVGVIEKPEEDNINQEYREITDVVGERTGDIDQLRHEQKSSGSPGAVEDQDATERELGLEVKTAGTDNDDMPSDKPQEAAGKSPGGTEMSETEAAVRSKEDGSLKVETSFRLSPEEFEGKWTAWTSSDQFEVAASSDISPAAMLGKLQGSGFQTMAATPDEVEPWRAFLYTQLSSGQVFLMEVTVEKGKGCYVCIKSADDDAALRKTISSIAKSVFL